MRHNYQPPPKTLKADIEAPSFKEQRIKDILMRELHPFMCSDHQDRCIGYPDHKAEIDQATQSILALIEGRVVEGREEVLEMIAEDQGWEESRDYYAEKLGFPPKYKRASPTLTQKDRGERKRS